MARLLVPLCLLVSALPTAAQECVRVEGFAGRVETLSDRAQVELLTGLGPREYAGAGHLETGALARARLSWISRASLELCGRAGLEWSARGEGRLRAFEIERAELEVRRGPLLLDWPGGWHARFDTGAFRLAAQPGGALALETVAGCAPRVWISSGATFHEVHGPRAGERIVIGMPAGQPPAQSERWQPWSSVSWPWGADAAPTEPTRPAEEPPALTPALPPPVPEEPARDPEPPAAVRETLILPRGGLRVPPEEQVPHPAPEPETAPAAPSAQAPAPEFRGEPQPAPQAPSAHPASDAAPVPAPVPEPTHDAALWAGLAREEIVHCGALATELRAELALETTASGGIALRLRSDATRPAWVFRSGSDLELLPGTLAVFDGQGRLLAELGRLLEHPAPPGRCAPAAAGFAAAR